MDTRDDMSRGAIMLIAHTHACMHLSLALRTAIKLLLLSLVPASHTQQWTSAKSNTWGCVPVRGILDNLARIYPPNWVIPVISSYFQGYQIDGTRAPTGWCGNGLLASPYYLNTYTENEVALQGREVPKNLVRMNTLFPAPCLSQIKGSYVQSRPQSWRHFSTGNLVSNYTNNLLLHKHTHTHLEQH